MFADKLNEIREALTFDDVLLTPMRSPVDPVEIDVSSLVSRHIRVKTPVVSSPMDTVTEADMAIAMARNGGIGIIHRNLTANAQSQMISKVKREESIKIRNVHTIEPETSIADAREIMRSKNIAGMPVISNDKLVGIVTRRDIEFVGEGKKFVSEIMIKDVIYARDEIDIEDAKQVLYKNRIEKLPLIDSNGRVVGLITAKDIITRKNFPSASRDEEGQLLVGAAIGPFDIERAITLEKAGADLIVIDTAHAHNEKVMNAIKKLRKAVTVDLIGGNIATKEAAEDLIALEVDGIRVGIGPGSICTTRVIAGVGVPQITAISDVAEVAIKHGVPVIADGGVRFSGDIVKAIAAGADTVMLGSLLAGTDESPGTEMIMNGRKYKSYRGMGSMGVMRTGISDRYGKISSTKYVAEGIEGAVPYRGKIEDVLFQLVGGMKSGMGYVGAPNIDTLRKKGKFIKITANGLRENHPHDVRIVSEPPNYQMYQV